MSLLRKTNFFIIILLCLLNLGFHFYHSMWQQQPVVAKPPISQQEQRLKKFKLISAYESANSVSKISALCKSTSAAMEKMRCSTAFGHIADAYLKKGAKQKALTIYQQQSQYDSSGFSDFKVAEMHMDRGQFTAAIPYYQNALKKLMGKASTTRDKALNNLGIAYIHKKMYKEAFHCFEQLAERKNALAQLNLATMYGHGQGVSVDRKKAYAWAVLALEKGLVNRQQELSAHQIINAQAYWLRRQDPSGRQFFLARKLAREFVSRYA